MINPSLAKAKTEAEAKGYIFLTDHDEIISEAKKEGKLRVVSGLSPETLKIMVSAFRKKYPFIDISAHETTGSDEHQRILLELKAGMNKEWTPSAWPTIFTTSTVPTRRNSISWGCLRTE